MIRFLPFLLAVFVAYSVYAISMFTDAEVLPYTFMDVVPLAAWSSAYYWRFAIHLRELTEA